MEPYWCTEKNDIRNLMKIPRALSPCLKTECNLWRDGKCGHIDIRGYPDRPQVFSKQDYGHFMMMKNKKGNRHILLVLNRVLGVIQWGNIRKSNQSLLLSEQQYCD